MSANLGPYKYLCPGSVYIYISVRVMTSRILHEICLLVAELAIRGTILTLNARLGTKSNLLIEQYCY